MADAAELGAWLRLTLPAAVTRSAARRLLAAFGSPERVLSAAPSSLRDVAGGAAAAALIAPLDTESAARRQAALDWLAGGAERSVLLLGDAGYPAALLNTADPPLLLYLAGDAALLAADSLAVVGSRNPTPQGLDNARRFAASFVDADLTVVSGLALGIDGAAHEGALAQATAGGASTIAVVGTGLDIAYPSRHRALARRIAEHGLLVSEYAPGTPALPVHFPQRNRIIAGLSLGTLVVEAALRSGSLITARQASEAGREVFAIPGSIHAPQSRGCHALIRDGAKLVETAADVIDELEAMRRPHPAPSAAAAAAEEPPTSHPLLAAMGFDPVTLDALGARTGWATADLLAQLLELELDGRVARLPGGLYQQRASA